MEEQTNWISVQKYAAKVGVTPMSVYNAIKNGRMDNHIKMLVSNQVMVDADAPYPHATPGRQKGE